MDAILVALQRRLLCAAALAVCGWVGLESEHAKTWAQNVAIAAATFVPMAGYVWSYAKKIDRAHLSRRVVASIIPLTYAVLGALDLGLTDAERAGFAEGLKGLLDAIVGNPPPELLAAMGLAGAVGMSSAVLKNPLQPKKLGSPNP